MKQYDVKISHAALNDMEQIYSYIADRLLEPDTAMGQYNRIAEAIQSLNTLPERCALVESEPERTQGLRQMLVDNYSVFYIVGEDAVSVARVLYSASDLVRRLLRRPGRAAVRRLGPRLVQARDRRRRARRGGQAGGDKGLPAPGAVARADGGAQRRPGGPVAVC